MSAGGGEANLALLAEVAARLGALRESLVFVGGCATGLLVTAPRAQPIRMTLDVDLVAEVATLAAYHELERQFERLGFVHDVSVGAPICRWRMGKLVAFRDRGRGDYLASHDLEDLITIVDGRETLHDEVVSGPPALRRHIAVEVGALLRSDDFLSALSGQLPGNAAAQLRLPQLLQRLRRLAAIE